MKIIKLIVFPLFIFSVAGCFVGDNLIDNFRVINSSLEKLNDKLVADNQIQLGHLYKYKPLNKSIVAKADSLHYAVIEVGDFTGLLKKIMINQDSVGEDTHVAAQLIHFNVNEKLLKQKLTDVYNCSHAIFIYTKNPGLDTTIISLKKVKTDTAWTNEFFSDGVPTMAAVTTLSKLQNECLSAEKQSLSVLKDHLVIN